MKFGIFDYIDLRDEPPGKTFDDRMTLLQAAEAAGFHGYHLTEHHATPLSLAPSPSIFLAAAARETKRIRLGTLLYLLPLYQPLRLIEELCMLDHLSGGRLDIGVGTGASPHEFDAFGVDFATARDGFAEMFDILYQGLTQDHIEYHGKRFDIDKVTMVLKPLQRPYPPLWYGLRSDYGHSFAARYGMNAVTLGPTERIVKAIALFRTAWREHAEDRRRIGAPNKDALIGCVRAVFAADSDREAERFARPAWKHWFDGLAWLWKEHGTFPPISLSPDYDVARASGALVVGGPETVRRELSEQAKSCGFNYLIMQLAFGSLGHAHEMRSLDLIRREVMPALAETEVAALS